MKVLHIHGFPSTFEECSDVTLGYSLKLIRDQGEKSNMCDYHLHTLKKNYALFNITHPLAA